MTEELISVVIPTYNREATIERAVRSALDQTGDFRLEVLVVDDGSTDGTRQRVEAVGDERVRFIAADHRGACAARNRGIREAKGPYVAFLDSDDTWRPGKLAAQTRLLAEREADAVACAFMHHEGEKEFVIPAATVGEGWVSYRSLLGENIISTQTLLGLRLMMTLLPIAGLVVAFIFFNRRFKITDEVAARNAETLLARREGKDAKN